MNREERKQEKRKRRGEQEEQIWSKMLKTEEEMEMMDIRVWGNGECKIQKGTQEIE